MDQGALDEEVAALRIGTDEAIQVAGFELVGVAGQSLQVSHTVVARPGPEDVAEAERAERRVSACTAPAHRQTLGIGNPLGSGEEGGVGAVVDVDDTQRPGAARGRRDRIPCCRHS